MHFNDIVNVDVIINDDDFPDSCSTSSYSYTMMQKYWIVLNAAFPLSDKFGYELLYIR